ncbi:HNH endonuclease [compost metagenome]
MVSSHARIRSLRTGKILTPAPRKNGYISVMLTASSGLKSRFYAHRLVAEAFCGGCPADLTVNHLNFNRSDNRSANLEVVSQRENVNHSLVAGRYREQGKKSPIGSASVAAKLSEPMVGEIRRRHAEGERQTSLALEFGVGKRQVSNIVNRISWKHVA